MRESQLLEHIYRRSADLGESVLVGPGDDAAVVRIGAELALVTVDQLVEGRHYETETPVELVAHKAVARSLSDIAAMAGLPRFALATAAIREGYQQTDALFDAMHAIAADAGAPLVGGDIASTNGPNVLTVTVIGEPHATRGPVLRSWARPGDFVHVTGALGASLASGRHLRFIPRVSEATALATALGEDLHAMIDLSDGLGRDAARIAKASGVRIEIGSDLVPLSEGAADVRSAVADGEDYELLFTSPREHVEGATQIGWVLEGDGVGLIAGTETRDIAEAGWDH